MFTGLVETVGKVVELSPGSGSSRLGIQSDLPSTEIVEGDSISVDGACLTVTALRRDRFFADVVAETLQRTTLGRLRPGRRVNLERALVVGDRLGGHLVSGHVDATAEISRVVRRGGDYRLVVGMPPELTRYVALKGSVALQGVSLTVSGVDAATFEVALVPHTLERTTLGDLRAGDRANLEVDLVARYLESLVSREDRAG